MLGASVKNLSGMKAKHLRKTVASRLARPIYASAGEAMTRDSNEEAWVLILSISEQHLLIPSCAGHL